MSSVGDYVPFDFKVVQLFIKLSSSKALWDRAKLLAMKRSPCFFIIFIYFSLCERVQINLKTSFSLLEFPGEDLKLTKNF